ncbi:bacteriohemerythrin [Geobacter sp. SVR]|uniref:bacteriohemerythrin n=1 Tax=Geobacter sp. SVR TaxID=2495594 RepID=UPI00143EF59E|nr:hemerythrin family protein [Geobacter sp. SVR]BCS53974.1 hemerythrin [Geobacter sp. SVR]GCF86245.1 hemerythrin [Geobacter sp. SVR]
MSLAWDDTLTLGIDEIDSQHRELFDRFNALSQSFANGDRTHGLRDLLDYVNTYLKDHFPVEEEIMERHNYPKLQEHRNLHVDFLNEIKDLEAKINREGETHTLSLVVYKKLLQWMIRHIKNYDREMVVFIKERFEVP